MPWETLAAFLSTAVLLCRRQVRIDAHDVLQYWYCFFLILEFTMHATVYMWLLGCLAMPLLSMCV